MPDVEIDRPVIEVRVEWREQIWREAAAEDAEVVAEEGAHVVERLRPPVARRELQPEGSPRAVGQVGYERVVIGPAVIPQEKDGAVYTECGSCRVEPGSRRGGWIQEGSRRTWPVDVGEREEIVPVRARIL